MVKTTESNTTTAVEPFLSIIIPTYNPAEFLPTLLDSVMTNKCLDDVLNLTGIDQTVVIA